jgi:hypothetical protein
MSDYKLHQNKNATHIQQITQQKIEAQSPRYAELLPITPPNT